jgi:hypothetical protein
MWHVHGLYVYGRSTTPSTVHVPITYSNTYNMIQSVLASQFRQSTTCRWPRHKQAGLHHATSVVDVATSLAISPSSESNVSHENKIFICSRHHNSRCHSFSLIRSRNSQDLFRVLACLHIQGPLLTYPRIYVAHLWCS